MIASPMRNTVAAALLAGVLACAASCALSALCPLPAQAAPLVSSDAARLVLASEGSQAAVTAPVTVRYGDGTVDTVPCSFVLTSDSTCAVMGSGAPTGFRAVSLARPGTVVIPDSIAADGNSYLVEAVGEYAFAGMDRLIGVQLPEGLRTLGASSFAECANLHDVELPPDLVAIATRAFYGCESLTKVVVPAQVQSIGSYAFANALRIKTVVYEGDCPTVALYAFTGSTTIETVVFNGSSPESTSGRYNSTAAGVDQPAFYYSLTFYASREDAVAAQDGQPVGEPLGRALVTSVPVNRINTSLWQEALYDGAVPAFPQGCNVWRYALNTDRGSELSASQAVWPEYSDYDDLSKGRAQAANGGFRNEPIDSYVGPVQVYDAEEVLLVEGEDYVVQGYDRFDEATGAWVPTDDTRSPGRLRVRVLGQGTYHGILSAERTIALKSQDVFTVEVPNKKGQMVPVAFKLTSRPDADQLTVAVSRKLPNRQEMADQVPMFAVPASYHGDVIIPETVTVAGRQFTVTSVESSFSETTVGAGSSARVHYCGVTSVSVPSTVVSINSAAFQNAVELEEVIFRGDADGLNFRSVFTGCPLRRVVFYGKGIDTTRYVPSAMFGEKAELFYKVDFYDSEASYRANAQPWGWAVLSSTMLLGQVPDKTSAHLFDGEVPAYPYFEEVDMTDFPYAAPMWVYTQEEPGLPTGTIPDPDKVLSLTSHLQERTYAYAYCAPDAYSLARATIVDAQQGAAYRYDGRDWATSISVSLLGPVGGTLRPDADYTRRVEVFDPSQGVWMPAEQAVLPGTYRLVFEGAGNYATRPGNTTQPSVCYLEFSIETTELSLNTTARANVPLESPDGTQSTVPCQFKVVRVGDDRAVSVYASSGATAVAASTAGKLTIPEKILLNGLEYRVVSVEGQAFKQCDQLTAVSLPDSVESIGQGAFSYQAALRTVRLPQGLTALPASLFEGCTALGQIILPDSVTAIGNYAFLGCSALSSIDLPVGLETLGSSAFGQCPALSRVGIRSDIQQGASAFSGSGIREVDIDEGVTSLPASLFYRATGLKAVRLPESLQSVGSQCFSGSALASITLPAGLRTLERSAFGSCVALSTVVFEGDPNLMDVTSPFSGCTRIKAVVFRQNAPGFPEEFFPTMPLPPFYVQATFFAPDNAGVVEQVGEAAVPMGTLSAALNNAEALAVFDGAVPSAGDGMVWAVEGLGSGEAIEGPVAVSAVAADALNLESATVCTQGVYPFGSAVDPVGDGTAQLVLQDGTVLSLDAFDVSYEMRSGDLWAPLGAALPQAPGQYRLVVSPVESTGFKGQAVGLFSVTSAKVGDTFAVDTVEGVTVTYRVTGWSATEGCGLVAVGDGGSAVDASVQGPVTLPDSVQYGGATFKVMAVAPNAFYRCMGVTAVTVPSGVRTIGANAFAYEAQKTDTKTSGLAQVNIQADGTVLAVHKTAFVGCDVLGTLVYGASKGSFEQQARLSLREGVTLKRYFTVRLYEGDEDRLAGAAPAQVAVLREGCWPDAASPSDYYPGSARIPQLEEGFSWFFDANGLDDDARLADSLYAVKYQIPEDSLAAMVPYVSEKGVAGSVLCSFKVLEYPDGPQDLGAVTVGCLTDGMTAVDRSLAGEVTIPAVVSAGGLRYEVQGVGLYAFGGSTADLACSALAAVNLPSTVRSIDGGAFAQCAALGKVTVADGAPLTAIGAAAFQGCARLTELVLPEGLASIGQSAFQGSGLQRAVVPSTVQTVGKSAFADCTLLREVVFDGAYDLDLPALEGAAGSPLGVGDKQTVSALSVLDDWVLANCAALERVVFRLDIDQARVSSTFMQGSAPDQLVFLAGGGSSVQSEGAQRFYAVNFFADEDCDVSGLLGTAVVPKGTTYNQLLKGELWCGQVPALDDGYEWRVDFDAEEPLDACASVVRQQKRYAVDAGAVDAAFAVGVRVNGEASDQAAAGDTVAVEVESLGSPVVTGICVSNETGTVVAEGSSRSLTFAMPDGPVSVTVLYDMPVTVTVQRLASTVPEVHSVSLDDVRASCSEGSMRFSAWDDTYRYCEAQASSWIRVSDFLAAAGVRFAPGDSLVLGSTATGINLTLTYDELYGSDRFYFAPAANGADAAPAPPVLALAATVSKGAELAPGARPSMMQGFYFLAGQTATEQAIGRPTAGLWGASIDSIEVICGAQDVNECDIRLEASAFYATGHPVEPVVTVVDPQGRTLTNSDFVVSYSNNVAGGTATVTVRGIGAYQGTAQRTFVVRQAKSLGGAGQVAVAAAAAVEAYPEGSAGAVVVGAQAFGDSMAAASLAGLYDYPVVLTSAGSLDAAAKDALSYLSAGNPSFRIVVLGDTASVGSAAYTQLRGLVSKANYLTRLDGSTAVETAELVYEYGAQTSRWSDTLLVVPSGSFAEYLPAASYAFWAKAPVAAVDASGLPTVFKKALANGAFKRAVVLGASVPATVESSLKSSLGAGAVVRFAGRNAYEVSSGFLPWARQQGMTAEGSVVASGERFADAVAGAPLAGKRGAFMLCASASNTTSLSALAGQASSVGIVYFAGDGSLVTPAVRQAALVQLGWTSHPFADQVNVEASAVSTAEVAALQQAVAAAGTTATVTPGTSGAAGASAATSTSKRPAGLVYSASKAKVAKVYGAKAFSLAVSKKATTAKVTYASSNTKVAKVNAATGKVTIVGIGKATITATASANGSFQAGSAKAVVTVKPKKPSSLKLKKGSRALTASWKRDSKATGYQVQYSTSKKFAKSATKTKTLTKKLNAKAFKAAKLKISGLKSKKTYYVRVRTYTAVGSTKYYSAWSTVKKVKTK